MGDSIRRVRSANLALGDASLTGCKPEGLLALFAARQFEPGVTKAISGPTTHSKEGQITAGGPPEGRYSASILDWRRDSMLQVGGRGIYNIDYRAFGCATDVTIGR